MLRFCVKKGGALKTDIMYGVNLSFYQLNEKLELLMNWHWLEEEERKNRKNPVYVATKRGIRAAESFSKFLKEVPKEDLPLILGEEYYKFYTPPKEDTE